jgi:hypothetical protein
MIFISKDCDFWLILMKYGLEKFGD